MSSTLYCALAATAFAFARPCTGLFATAARSWQTGRDESGSFPTGTSPVAPTTAHVNAANGMKRITPGALGGLT